MIDPHTRAGRITTAPELTAADMINQLIRPYVTNEKGDFLERVKVRVPIPRTDNPDAWTTITIHDRPGRCAVQHPSLLDQLASSTSGGTALGDEAAGTRFGSKPAAHLEALQLLARIDRESRDVATDLGVADPGSGVPARLSAIAGRLGTDPHKTVRSWWSAARLLTHWDAPPYRPQGAPCPNCWDTGSLRIRFDDQLAVCTTCHATWDRTGHPDAGSLDLLGQHVKWCTDHEVTKARHWSHDDTGELIECTECLTFRDAYTEWKLTRQADTPATKAG